MEMMEAMEVEMNAWILELKSTEPWLQQRMRLHAKPLGPNPLDYYRRSPTTN
jgi:hypothetical protein